jgi:hypothetical protein
MTRSTFLRFQVENATFTAFIVLRQFGGGGLFGAAKGPPLTTGPLGIREHLGHVVRGFDRAVGLIDYPSLLSVGTGTLVTFGIANARSLSLDEVALQHRGRQAWGNGTHYQGS